METIIYSARNDSDEKRLLQNIDSASVTVCRTVTELRKYLSIPDAMRKIVITVICSQDELSEITTLIEMNFNLMLVAVLAHDLFETGLKVHRLRPRYITFKESDFQDVASVLRRLTDYTALHGKNNQ